MTTDMDNLREQIADEVSGFPIGSGYYGTVVAAGSEAYELADLILPIVREAQAEAWEQGNRIGWSDCTLDTVAAPIAITTNPYRTEQS